MPNEQEKQVAAVKEGVRKFCFWNSETCREHQIACEVKEDRVELAFATRFMPHMLPAIGQMLHLVTQDSLPLSTYLDKSGRRLIVTAAPGQAMAAAANANLAAPITALAEPLTAELHGMSENQFTRLMHERKLTAERAALQQRMGQYCNLPPDHFVSGAATGTEILAALAGVAKGMERMETPAVKATRGKG